MEQIHREYKGTYNHTDYSMLYITSLVQVKHGFG